MAYCCTNHSLKTCLHTETTLAEIKWPLHPDDIFKYLFEWKFMNFDKFDPKGPINNIPALVQMMAWCRSGDKPLSEPTLVNLLAVGATRVTRPQWCKEFYISYLRVCSTSYRTNHTFSIKTGKATLGSMTCRNDFTCSIPYTLSFTIANGCLKL